jgi:hypothetical protein
MGDLFHKKVDYSSYNLALATLWRAPTNVSTVVTGILKSAYIGSFQHFCLPKRKHTSAGYAAKPARPFAVRGRYSRWELGFSLLQADIAPYFLVIRGPGLFGHPFRRRCITQADLPLAVRWS